jgi:hypothetical protein
MKTRNGFMNNFWRDVALLALLLVGLAASGLTGRAQSARATSDRQVT